MFSHIIIVIHYNNEWGVVVQWQRRAFNTNRTWVWIPGPPIAYCYFSSGNPTRFRSCGSPYTITQSSARWPQARSGGPYWRPMVGSSQRARGESKSQPGLQRNWAIKLQFSLLFQAHTPLSHSISLFLFILFICLINYIYYLNNQSRLFPHKIKNQKNIFYLLKLNSALYFCK